MDLLTREVQAVLGGSRPADYRITGLVALVGATAVLDQLVARPDRRAARKRAKELAETLPVAEAARAVIRDAQAAVIASFGAAAGAVSGN